LGSVAFFAFCREEGVAQNAGNAESLVETWHTTDSSACTDVTPVGSMVVMAGAEAVDVQRCLGEAGAERADDLL
jgi:hypothetical protein